MRVRELKARLPVVLDVHNITDGGSCVLLCQPNAEPEGCVVWVEEPGTTSR